MKKSVLITILTLLVSTLIHYHTRAQASSGQMPTLGFGNPWTEKQVIEPYILASMSTDAKINKPVILNIGAVGDIKGAQHIGAVSEAQNMKN